MSYNPLSVYRQTSYTKSVDDFKPKQYMYKFESPNHFVSIVEELQVTGKRNSHENSSEDRGQSFSGSDSMEDAIEKFRTAEFDSVFARNASILVNQMRQRMVISDEGEEISVQEYIAKADHFIKYTGKNYKRPAIVDIPIFIQCVYSCGEDQEEMMQVGKNLLTAMYQMKLRCPKIVFMFVSEGFYSIPNEEKHAVFVECNFMDFNSFSKMLLPSTFRRMWFRIAEMFEDLPGGYGSVWRGDSRLLEEGFSMLAYKGMSIEAIKNDIDKKIREYAHRSSMARSKAITV